MCSDLQIDVEPDFNKGVQVKLMDDLITADGPSNIAESILDRKPYYKPVLYNPVISIDYD